MNAAGLAGPAHEFERLWRAFMTARVTLGVVLVVLQGAIFFLLNPGSVAALLVSLAYVVAALVVRIRGLPRQLGSQFDARWLRTVGMDVLAFATLQFLQSSSINYTPLFALPVLMTSVLGPRILALGAAAGVTLLLFAYASWSWLNGQSDPGAHFLQAALTGAGCFVISFVANQVATRLASVELSAQRSLLDVAVQRQVNALVIESLTEGILVVDERSYIRSANPAARLLLGQLLLPAAQPRIDNQPGWHALWQLVQRSFSSQQAQQSALDISNQGQALRHLWVRTQLSSASGEPTLGLCVVFMQDQRELQARIRAEKLTSMGRMSAAVAHEIRNPLAAIAQANALLAEDLCDPEQQRLAAMVQQNAQRLEKIVSDVLHLAGASGSDPTASQTRIDLTATVLRICRDWGLQLGLTDRLFCSLDAETVIEVSFDPDHLRRILINLLDNAHRYASRMPHSIQVDLGVFQEGDRPEDGRPRLCVWSDGAPLDPSVEQHLFEPFFSSESRSSGLGLYISRELCDSHGAKMSYQRCARVLGEGWVLGNEFSLQFKCLAAV